LLRYKEKTGRDTSPFIDSIAAQGVVFEKCYAPNIPTHPSFTTMLTGKEAITHDIVNIGGGVPIKDGIRMIQEILQEQGWQTGAVDTMGPSFFARLRRISDFWLGQKRSADTASRRTRYRLGGAAD
jgi:hypothetical protein